jgi:uncharacterized membrane protein YfcA
VLPICGDIEWRAAAVMAPAALAGGAIGGVLAARVSPRLLRIAVVVVALSVAGVYFARM